jgi:Glyoxalase/Bleomycin resistance protein/Dioxygenase superfamily
VGRVVQCHTGDGNYLEIFANGSAEPKPEGCIIHFALRTDNCDAAVERARAAGVVITTEPKDVVIQSIPKPTPVRLAFCEGPDGEIISSFKTQRPERLQLLRIVRHRSSLHSWIMSARRQASPLVHERVALDAIGPDEQEALSV